MHATQLNRSGAPREPTTAADIRRHVEHADRMRSRALTEALRRFGRRIHVGAAPESGGERQGVEQPAWNRPRPLVERFELWRERQARRKAVYRELTAYTDNELLDISIHRSDIPRIARSAA